MPREMISILIIAVVLLGTARSSNSLHCPTCKNDCGSTGYLTCDACLCYPDCSHMSPGFCQGDKECVMLKLNCIDEPCAPMPNCIVPSKTCGSGSIPRDDAGSLITCGELDECPKDYKCKQVPGGIISICCGVGKDIITVPEISSPPHEDNAPPLWMIPNITNDGPRIDTSDDCQECASDACDMGISCPDYPMATCVTDDCTCTSWFIDENEERVDCFKSNSESMVIPDFFFPLLTTTPVSTAMTSQAPLAKPAPVTSEGGMVSKTLIQHVIIGSCIVFAIVVCLLIVCKLVHTKRKNVFRKQQEEQLKPLQIANNNKMDIA